MAETKKGWDLRPKVVDLFCGCGGLSAGFARAGFEISAGVDILGPPLATFHRNFPDAVTRQTDLSTEEPGKLRQDLRLRRGELDVLVGGPPCQGFSKNVPASQRSLRDPKNQLILTFLEFVSELHPRYLLIENVAEMRNAFGEAYSAEIRKALARLGYTVREERLLAADFGVPQLRRRAFFLGSRDGDIGLPVATHAVPTSSPSLFGDTPRYVTVDQAISDLPPLEAGEGQSPIEYPAEPETEYQSLMRKAAGVLHDHVARPLATAQLARVRSLAPGSGQGSESLPDMLKPKSGYSGAYARLFPNEPARTITRWVFHPGSGRYFHPYQDRVITIREAARLQSFPDDFVFEGTYIQKAHQVGEAVPPLLAEAFAHSISRVLRPESVPQPQAAERS